MNTQYPDQYLRFGLKVQYYRKLRGMTQEAFAEKITALYQDNDRLGAMCRRSQEYIREYFSLDGAWKNIEEDFS